MDNLPQQSAGPMHYLLSYIPSEHFLKIYTVKCLCNRSINRVVFDLKN